MTRWFKKEPDRLSEEIERLKKNQKLLEKQAALLEKQLSQPVSHEEKEITRMAKFKLDAPLRGNLRDSRKKRKLRVHHKRTRNRFFIMFALLIFLGLVLWRLLS